jgi:PhoH-like ATPase
MHNPEKKTFIIDTNVLINDPRAFLKFDNNEVNIPLIVVQELDGLKKRTDTTGQAAREVARILDDYRAEGNLSDGILLPNGGILKVLHHHRGASSEVLIDGVATTNDHMILQQCKDLGATLVTEDTNMRIIADAIGVHAERYRNTIVDNSELYMDVSTVVIADAELDYFYDAGFISYEDSRMDENEYVLIHNESDTHSGLAKFSKNKLKKIKAFTDGAIGLVPKNKEQCFALDALYDENVNLVVLAGPAGTGKTLLTLAAGLDLVTNKHKFQKLTVCRPIIPVGRDMGFLPGNVDEKIDPWMGPIQDSIDFLIPSSKKDAPISNYEYLKGKNIIQIAPLTYLRGRSLPNQLILVDEAQNLTHHEMKTILTRAGKGTKVVLSGDPYQIDSPYLDQYNNGMSYVIDKFTGKDMFAHITLKKGERSPLAEMAATIL